MSFEDKVVEENSFDTSLKCVVKKVKFKRLNPEAKVVQATKGSAGFDLVATEATQVSPGDRAMVSTGLALEIPEGYEAQVRPRSGLAAKHGITVLNSPGTIDSDYRGEVKVILHNTGRFVYSVAAGDKIAQLVIQRVPTVDFVEVDELSSTERGAGGFGSTGK